MRFRTIGVAIGLATLASIQAATHHSQTMYDGDTEIEMRGVVEQFDWTNPHTWLYVTIEGEDGASSQWVFESNSTGQLTRGGWSADSIKSGDEVTIIMHPLRDGTRGGTIVSIHMPDGTILPSGGMRPDPIRGSEVIDR